MKKKSTWFLFIVLKCFGNIPSRGNLLFHPNLLLINIMLTFVQHFSNVFINDVDTLPAFFHFCLISFCLILIFNCISLFSKNVIGFCKYQMSSHKIFFLILFGYHRIISSFYLTYFCNYVYYMQILLSANSNENIFKSDSLRSFLRPLCCGMGQGIHKFISNC